MLPTFLLAAAILALLGLVECACAQNGSAVQDDSKTGTTAQTASPPTTTGATPGNAASPATPAPTTASDPVSGAVKPFIPTATNAASAPAPGMPVAGPSRAAGQSAATATSATSAPTAASAPASGAVKPFVPTASNAASAPAPGAPVAAPSRAAGQPAPPVASPTPAPTSSSAPVNGASKPVAATPPAESAPADPSGALEQTAQEDSTVRVGLNIQHLDIGMPLPVFGKNLAVVPAQDGHKCVGLNGVNASEASFSGKGFKNFQIDAAINFNFPFREGKTFSKELLSLRLGTSAQRTFMVTIKQGEAEPPMAVFSLAGPKLAPDMFCTTKPLRWKEDMPDATTKLLVKKEAGAIRFEYNGELVCTSPLDPSLPLTGFSAPLAVNARIYDMALTQLPDAGAPGASAPGHTATAEGQEQAFPSAEIGQSNGVTHFDLSKLSSGTPVGALGKNLVVLDDEEGKYIASAAPEGSYVLFPGQTGKDFSVGILIKNAFVLNKRNENTDRFFLFRVNYKNGIRELYAISLTRTSDLIWRSRYFISRGGADSMDWSVATDYRPWNNAIDFNEYKVIKEKNLLRFFVNGEFIRSEKTLGDAFESVKVDLRGNERLYDIIVRDLAIAGPEQKSGPGTKERSLSDAPKGNGQATAPVKGKGQ